MKIILKKDILKKILLSHKHPLNFILHVIGVYFIAGGLWLHNTIWITLGVFLLIIGITYALSHKAKHEIGWYNQLVKLYLIKTQIPFHIASYLLLILGLWKNDLLIILIGIIIKVIGYVIVYLQEEKNLGLLFYFFTPKNKYKVIKRSIKK